MPEPARVNPWLIAMAVWRLGNVEKRWAPAAD